MSAIQSVLISGHEERALPKPHIVYRIEIKASVRSWQMWRRYSEFDELNTELTKTTGSPPPCPLPPKHIFKTPFKRSLHDEKILQERVQGLEDYLRAIVSSKDDKWRESFAFKQFLAIPVGRPGGSAESGGGAGPSEFTSASWLDEHMELLARVREIRADVNKRDALSNRGDSTLAHSTNVQAKKKLTVVLTRLGTLASGLQTLSLQGMAEGETQRRTDMAARLQDECENLSRMMMAARLPPRGSGAAGGKTQAPEEDRSALFANAPAPANKPFARVFGAESRPKETDETRPLDDVGLLQLQKTQIERQDGMLSQLSSILIRQKQLGIAIGQEIGESIDALDALDKDVDRTGAKLGAAKKQLNRLG